MYIYMKMEFCESPFHIIGLWGAETVHSYVGSHNGNPIACPRDGDIGCHLWYMKLLCFPCSVPKSHRLAGEIRRDVIHVVWLLWTIWDTCKWYATMKYIVKHIWNQYPNTKQPHKLIEWRKSQAYRHCDESRFGWSPSGSFRGTIHILYGCPILICKRQCQE